MTRSGETSQSYQSSCPRRDDVARVTRGGQFGGSAVRLALRCL
jgi:hypothetical protein